VFVWILALAVVVVHVDDELKAVVVALAFEAETGIRVYFVKLVPLSDTIAGFCKLEAKFSDEEGGAEFRKMLVRELKDAGANIEVNGETGPKTTFEDTCFYTLTFDIVE